MAENLTPEERQEYAKWCADIKEEAASLGCTVEQYIKARMRIEQDDDE